MKCGEGHEMLYFPARRIFIVGDGGTEIITEPEEWICEGCITIEYEPELPNEYNDI